MCQPKVKNLSVIRFDTGKRMQGNIIANRKNWIKLIYENVKTKAEFVTDCALQNGIIYNTSANVLR